MPIRTRAEDHLAEVPLFRDLDRHGLKTLAGRLITQSVPAGTMLIEEGRVGYECYIVTAGTAVVSRRGNESKSPGRGRASASLRWSTTGRVPRPSPPNRTWSCSCSRSPRSLRRCGSCPTCHLFLGANPAMGAEPGPVGLGGVANASRRMLTASPPTRN